MGKNAAEQMNNFHFRKKAMTIIHAVGDLVRERFFFQSENKIWNFKVAKRCISFLFSCFGMRF